MLKMKTKEEIKTITNDAVKRITTDIDLNIKQIILYGSYARGDANEESDVDIMILCDDNVENIKAQRAKITRIGSSLCLDYDIEISLLFKDTETFYKWERVLPFYQNVLREGVGLYG